MVSKFSLPKISETPSRLEIEMQDVGVAAANFEEGNKPAAFDTEAEAMELDAYDRANRAR